MKSIFLYILTKKRDQIEETIKMQMTCSIQAVNLQQIKWLASLTAESEKIYWSLTEQIVKKAEISSFLNALTVFVKENQNKIDEIRMSVFQLNCKESDALWIQSYQIAVHLSIWCWWHEDKDTSNLEKLTKKIVCCTSFWQNHEKNWRWDFVWVQKYEENLQQNEVITRYLNEKLLDQLQLIITVIDQTCYDQDDKSLYYINTLMNTLYS